MSLPSKCEYLIIGGGIHGLSTAWHLCKKLSSKGQLKEDSVVVIEKQKLVKVQLVLLVVSLETTTTNLRCVD